MRMALAIVLGTVAVYVWGMIFWMNPLPGMAVRQAPDDAAAQQAIGSALGESGLYMIPYPDYGDEAAAARHEAGPIAIVHFSREGRPVMPPTTLLKSLANNLIMVVLMAILLKMVASALPTYGARLLAMSIAGSVGGIAGVLADTIWWNQSMIFTVFLLAFAVTSAVVAAAVLGLFIKPETEEAAGTEESGVESETATVGAESETGEEPIGESS